ncbi:RagB/SusD family nutrient uptake outer membrane protein [Aestuariibaculum sediminum]|uniref:RagB/SusD family nutrient uptake outer membrane protein n=1 Tax=Aestuariibaculum sediminum TaxID=2770637 RepID=A0A8J6Q236_9FLAO|nr:RagB/SusD family nutrient uptake outer membrane protein [Aestuariibaculum sediminum]MBD0831619.1 RagB/SusD family nutrient uptake outer membrane protein [Aestuariibaculum sediminum]
MKYIYKLFSIITLSIITISCSDDFLNLKPSTSLSELDVFTDEALLTNFVNNNYGRAFRDKFHRNPADEGITDNGQGRDAIYTDFVGDNFNSSRGEGFTANLWSTSFSTIRNVNLFFEKTEGNPNSLDESTLLDLSGQMRYIRSWVYFDLLRTYGGVPIVTETYNLETASEIPPRSSIQEVGAFILGELDKAITELPEKGSEAIVGRINKDVAMALKGRLTLYLASPLYNNGSNGSQQQWEAARDANKAILDLNHYDLNTPYENIFLQGTQNTSSTIFAKTYSDALPQPGERAGRHILGCTHGGYTMVQPTQDLVNAYQMNDGQYPYEEDLVTVNPNSGYDEQNPYVNRDPRFYKSILFQGSTFSSVTTPDHVQQYWQLEDQSAIGADVSIAGVIGGGCNSQGGYNFRKYADGRAPTQSTTPWVYFRLAEFELNYAEAQLQLGDEDEARAALNRVRNRPGIEMPPISDTVTGAELWRAYHYERRIELVFEGHRWQDGRRWMMGKELFEKQPKGTKIIRTDGGNTGDAITVTYEHFAVDIQPQWGPRKWNNKAYWAPIPPNEIVKSEDVLTQNPGWD